MTLLPLNHGTAPDDDTGDTLFKIFGDVASNFNTLDALQSQTINAGAIDFVGAGSNENKIQAAIDLAFSQGKDRVFVPAFMLPYNAALVTFRSSVQMVREGGDWSGNDAQAYGAAGNGIQDDSIAIQRAINDAVTFGGFVNLPAGNYKIVTGLTINGAVTMAGAGGPSDSDGGFGTIPQTQLTYTGSAVALTLVASPAQGIKNIHLRDFSLVGSSSADGGILIGTGATAAQMVQHSSIKNVTVVGFNKTGAYGVSFRRMITSNIENCLTVGCYDGFYFPTDSIVTTLTFSNCHAYSSDRNGLRCEPGSQTWSVTFLHLVSESNDAAAVYLDGALAWDFYNLYCEANNLVSGTGTVELRGTGALPCNRVNFYSPYMIDPAGGDRAFDLDNADTCLIFYPTLEWSSTDWCAVTSATNNCIAYTNDDLAPSTVTGNAVGRMQVLGRSSALNYEEGTWTPIDSSGAALAFTGVAGTYERIGRQVTARATLTYPATADASNAVIGGLPYTVANAQDTRGGGVLGYCGEPTIARLHITNNATTFQPLTAAGAAITNATFSGDQLNFTIIYRV